MDKETIIGNAINENEKKVLTVLSAETDTLGERCIYFSLIEYESKLTTKEVRKACRSLRKKGLAYYYRGLMNDDGEVGGSGYCISQKGQDLANKLEL